MTRNKDTLLESEEIAHELDSQLESMKEHLIDEVLRIRRENHGPQTVRLTLTLTVDPVEQKLEILEQLAALPPHQIKSLLNELVKRSQVTV
jgi:hypothetical protein